MTDAAAVTDLAGLSEDEARDLQRQGRANTAVSGSGRTTARILHTTVFSFYNNTLFVIGAALLALGRYSDALISVGLGVINAALAAIQEIRARRTLNRLQLLAREDVTVVREGRERQVAPSEVVLGDLVCVRAGDQIVVDGPVAALTGADGRALEVDESLLTGEADPLSRAVGDGLLSGSSCVGGQGLQRAAAVGADSYAGRLTVAARVDTLEQTALQRNIELVVRLLITLVVLMSGAILAQTLLDGSTVLRLVQTSAVLSGLVPYGLFFLIAVAYSVSAARLSRRGTLVQRVNAVEAISRVDVLCTDKTGTLTTGSLSLVEVVVAPGADEQRARRLLGTFARSVSATNATTAALATDDSLPGARAELSDEVEFRSDLRWSGVNLAHTDEPRSVILGAPATLRSALEDPEPDLRALDEQCRRLTGQGYRVLLLATGSDPLRVDGDPALPRLHAVAVVALADELRDGATDVVARLAAQRVTLKVISGDDPGTVGVVARRAGITGPVIDGPALTALEDGAALDRAAFDRAVDTHAVFGRISPEQKEQIVDALRRRGHDVAMIGDGVNDARALKRAQVGVAMGSGSSVTRDVADIVLLDDSFAAVVPARIEGRRVVTGIGTSMYLFMARVVSQMLVILTVTLLGLGFPYTPTQVGLTLFTVGVPTFFLTLWARPDPVPTDLLARLARFVLPVGILTALFGTAVYAVLYQGLSGLLDSSTPDPRAITAFENYTGLTYGTDTDFTTVSATLAAQSALSVFISTTAFILILLLHPPTRLFTAWTSVSDDRRPTWLAVALFVVFFAVLIVPATRTYFGLTAPDPPVLLVSFPAVLLWFGGVSVCLRHRVLERAIGLPVGRSATAAGPRR